MANHNHNEQGPGGARCAFCGKGPHEVSTMIQAPDGTSICDECIAYCADTLGHSVGMPFGHGAMTPEQAEAEGITRTQAAIRRAVEEHPEALYVFGNAPTALMELSRLIRLGKARPCGIIAAPVGFVHVCESKHGVKPFTSIPKIIVEGRKGGSNLAATLVNSILCWPDAAALKPGRDV